MKSLIEQCQKRGVWEVKGEYLDCSIPAELAGEIEQILALPADSPITPEIATSIKALWACQGIQNVYSLRSHYQLPDAAEYYFSRVDEYAKEDFVPSYDDILRIRVRTTGIAETSFEIPPNTFKVFDVGGQRNERRKWVHCFEDVTAVIFVASLSEYDQMLYEDETVPRMTEALNLFGEITNSRWFKNTAVLLFLNKSDLFREKIQHTPISVFFDDYAGDPHSFSMSALHIQTHFEARNRQSNREIYTHVTCATDTQNVEKVFTAAKDIVIKASLRKGGLL
jgi:GTPase SAR1 family protein